MSTFDIDVAEMEGEKHDHVFEHNSLSRSSSEYSGDTQVSQHAEETSLIWGIYKSPIRFVDKASPRQNTALIKCIVVAIITVFALLNLLKIVNTVQTNRTIQLERHVEQQIDDEIPPVGVVMASFRKQNVAWAEDVPEKYAASPCLTTDSNTDLDATDGAFIVMSWTTPASSVDQFHLEGSPHTGKAFTNTPTPYPATMDARPKYISHTSSTTTTISPSSLPSFMATTEHGTWSNTKPISSKRSISPQ